MVRRHYPVGSCGLCRADSLDRKRVSGVYRGRRRESLVPCDLTRQNARSERSTEAQMEGRDVSHNGPHGRRRSRHSRLLRHRLRNATMSANNSPAMDLSRRDFLRGMTAAGLSTIAGGVTRLLVAEPVKNLTATVDHCILRRNAGRHGAADTYET